MQHPAKRHALFGNAFGEADSKAFFSISRLVSIRADSGLSASFERHRGQECGAAEDFQRTD